MRRKKRPALLPLMGFKAPPSSPLKSELSDKLMTKTREKLVTQEAMHSDLLKRNREYLAHKSHRRRKSSRNGKSSIHALRG